MADRRPPRRISSVQPEFRAEPCAKYPPIGWRWGLAIVPLALNLFVIATASWALVAAIQYVEFVLQSPIVGG